MDRVKGSSGRTSGAGERASGSCGKPACRTSVAVLAIACILVGILAPRSSAVCSDYANSMRWVSGMSFWGYVPGGNPQGTLDLAKTGSKVLAVDDISGLIAFEETAVGQIQLRGSLPMEGYALYAAGNRAYVASGDGGLNIVNTADLSRLSLVMTLNIPGAYHVDVAGLYAYVGSYSEMTVAFVGGIPRVVGHLAGEVRDLAVRGNRAYVTSSSGLEVADVSNPAAPIYLEIAYSSNSLYDVAISGDLLYVIESNYGLRIFSLANPDSPALLSGLYVTDARSVVVSGAQAVIGGSGTTYVDVSDPMAPRARGTYQGINARGGVFSQGFLYCAAGFYGVQVLALDEGTMPEEITSLSGSARGVDLHAEGGVLTLLTGAALQTIDVSNPEAPVQIGSTGLSGGRAMAVEGDHAYVADHDGLKVVDLTDPALPQVVGFLPGLVADYVLVSGDRVYAMAYYRSDLWIIDVTNPVDPVLLNHTGVGPYGVNAATIIGTSLFVAGNFEGTGSLDKWDVSDPNNVLHEDWTMFNSWITDMAPLSDRLIVATQKAIEAVDPNDLHSQQHLGDHSFDGEIALGANDVFYTANTRGGYAVLSYDGTLHYLETGATPAGSGARAGIAEVAGYVYVTDDYALHVFGPPCASSSVAAAGRSGEGTLRSIPNPFSRGTSIAFEIPRGSGAGLRGGSVGGLSGGTAVALRIYDSSGRLVRTLLSGSILDAGTHAVNWDGRDGAGNELPSGVYLARVESGGGVTTRKMILSR